MKFEPGTESATEAAASRRRLEGWHERYLLGTGLDIGCGKSTIVPNARGWDIALGDSNAEALVGIENVSQDFVYASHVLEHLKHPIAALSRWWEVLKPGGFLLLAVPEEDSYEMGMWPSINNPDHKTTWSAHKDESWSNVSHNLLGLLSLLPNHKVHSIRLVADGDLTSVESIVEKGPAQPKYCVNTMIATVSCMCGCKSLLFRGTNFVLDMVFQCLGCGQTLKFSATQHYETAKANVKILQAQLDLTEKNNDA